MADHYAREAARLAAVQLADSAGFDVVQQSCVEILADLLLRYVHEAGAASHHYAELAGRSETNPVDVALALNDLGTSIDKLRDFVRHSPEVPFEQNISTFPLRKKSRPPPTFLDRGEVPPPHIPPWLPALPDRHTYMATPVYPGHEKDPHQRQLKLTEQRQQAESAAVRLQARLAADTNQLLAAKLPRPEGAAEGQAAAAEQQGAEQQGRGAAAGGAGQAGAAADGAASGNPFFAAPWGELSAEQLPEPPQQQQQQQRAAALGSAGGSEAVQQPPAVDREPSGVEWSGWVEPPAASSGGIGMAGNFAAQPLFAPSNWKAAQQRRALIATSGRAVREAFGEAYEEQAAVRLGKRQKRSGRPDGGVVAAVHDPTRARVENILAFSVQPVAAAPGAAGASQEDIMQEQI